MSSAPGAADNAIERAMCEAMALHRARRLDEAAAAYERVLAVDAEHAGALHGLGIIAFQKGNPPRAIELISRAIAAEPVSAEFHLNLAQICTAAKDLPRAEAAFRETARLAPAVFDAHYGLGVLLARERRFGEAAEAFEKAAAIQPTPQVYLDLGMAQKVAGDMQAALAAIEQSLRIRPDFTPALLQAGIAERELGKLPESENRLRQAAALATASADVWVELGATLELMSKTDDAAACHRWALHIDANNAAAHHHLARIARERGDADDELAHLGEAMRFRPADLLRVEQALVLPLIYPSADDVAKWRTRVENEVARLREQKLRIDISEKTAVPPFRLAYQGLNDRDLQRAIASLYAAPHLNRDSAPAKRADGRTRIGFISAFLRDHTIGLLNRGLIRHLSRERFAVTVISAGKSDDELARSIRRSADEHIQLPSNLPAARRAIAELGLDVLFYTDLGMDPFTYTLAFSRLARVQCATWGHPSTTGISNIDYFISSELLEIGPEAQAHYSEQLVRLPNLAVYYDCPPAPVATRADFALPPDRHWYACLENLFKLHPDFDAILAEILRRDPQGIVVLLRGLHPQRQSLLMRRWATTMLDVIDRIHFVERVDRPRFLGLCAAFDVILDPMHFSGGNSSYEAMSVGTPIVTLPSQFLRGRITLALYKQMGVMDCVADSAEEYVSIAIRVGTDAPYRDDMRKKIRAASGVLFENTAGVRELEQFFESAVTSLR